MLSQPIIYSICLIWAFFGEEHGLVNHSFCGCPDGADTFFHASPALSSRLWVNLATQGLKPMRPRENQGNVMPLSYRFLIVTY